MRSAEISRRGVYYNLDISPYTYKAPYGEIFKFSSAKKLEIYTRLISEQIAKIDKLLRVYTFKDDRKETIKANLMNNIFYTEIYKKVEGVQPWQDTENQKTKEDKAQI
jgi:hypothetical protein